MVISQRESNQNPLDAKWISICFTAGPPDQATKKSELTHPDIFRHLRPAPTERCGRILFGHFTASNAFPQQEQNVKWVSASHAGSIWGKVRLSYDPVGVILGPCLAILGPTSAILGLC